MTIIRKRGVDTRIERQIITGMIMSTDYLEGIQQLYKPGVLRASYVQTIAQWCQEYYEAYRIAPGREIQDVFIEKKKAGIEPDTADFIEEFLAELSTEYEDSEVTNVERLLEKTEIHFRLSSLENARLELTKCITGGRIEDGEAVMADFQRITRFKTAGVDPFLDMQRIAAALDQQSGDRLFKLYGALGDMLGPFERGWLFAFVGSQGKGKSWWLMLVAIAALFAGLRVLFISLEMSEKQMIYRFQQWATGLPKRLYAEGILLPEWDCGLNQRGECTDGCGVTLLKADGSEQYKPDFTQTPPGYQTCTLCKGSQRDWKYELATWGKIIHRDPLTISASLSKAQALINGGVLKPNRIRIDHFPSGKFSMQELETYMNNLEYYDGFVPDVLITDYADKFSNKTSERRDGLNDIWEAHKAIAQERKILVATASQSNTARTGKDITQGDWAEDIRKLGLVDAGISINQTPVEKREGTFRCGMLKQRDDDFDILGEAVVLQSLKIGRPYLDSYYKRG